MSWVDLAKQVAAETGCYAPILLATVECEDSSNGYLVDTNGLVSAGYGQVQICVWYDTFIAPTAQKFGISLPGKPDRSDTALQEQIGQIFSDNPEFSMTCAALVVKHYWDAWGGDFWGFLGGDGESGGYMGGLKYVPKSEQTKRYTAFLKWQGDPNAAADGTNGSPGNMDWTAGSGMSGDPRFAANNQEWMYHTVQKGESLASIAKQYYTTVDFLNKWNGITEGTFINPGMKLRVYAYYTLQPGDSMADVARMFSTAVYNLYDVSGLKQGSTLSPGQKIRIPAASVLGDPPTSITMVQLEASMDGFQIQKASAPPIFGSAPSVADDEYPAFRYGDNPFAMRIGDVQLYIPPTWIRVEKQGSIDSINILRASGGMKTKSGYVKRQIQMRIIFGDTDQINGYQVKGPGGLTYYMDGLRPLIAQFYRTPFLPIRHELLNNHHEIYTVAFQNLTFETIPEFPGAIVGNLTLVECTQEPFTQYPDYFFDNMIMYPLFRWWYQQQLFDDMHQRLSNRYLRPVPQGQLRGDFSVRVLDRDLVEQFQAKFGPYELSKEKILDLSSLMTDWPLGNTIIERIRVGISKNLMPLQIDDQTVPAFQDLGGTSKEIYMDLICPTRDELESVNNLMTHLEEMSRDYRIRFVSGFMEVSNEIINLAGIDYCMIMGMSSENIEDFDDGYRVSLVLRSFDPSQKNNERLFGVNSPIANPAQYIEDKNSRNDDIYLDSKIEKLLETLELYPDLELPTYSDVNEIIPKINSQRVARKFPPLPFSVLPENPTAMYVDPDFYVAYPPIENIFNVLDVGQFGEKIVNLLQTGSYQDNVVNNQDFDIGSMIDFTNQGLIDGWNNPDFKKAQVSTIQKNVGQALDLMTAHDYYIDVGVMWGDANPQPQQEQLLQMMCHDMVLYDKRGRLCRAFPTYLIMFVDEGQWLNGRRLWNDYYTYHAIQEITVVKDKKNPIDLAYINLTNIYGAFDTTSRLYDPRDYSDGRKTLWQRISDLWNNVWISIDDQAVNERTVMLEHAKLLQGTRIHIRMGYGASAYTLSTVFNGQIASINDGDQIQLVCQSDGVELVAAKVGRSPSDSTPITQGEPQNIMKYILATRASEFWFDMLHISDSFSNLDSAFGIEHFGIVNKRDDGGYWENFWAFVGDQIFDTNNRRDVYDILKNCYRGSATPYTGETPRWDWNDHEENIQVSTFNKTPWDIFQTLALFMPEFICAAHPHGFRSTLFYGMPHWMMKYGYVLKPGREGNVITDYQEKVKPFQQFHLILSGYDIINNDVQASSEQIMHTAMGVYAEGGGGTPTMSSEVVYADRSIKPEQQKMMVVDTGVAQDLPGWDSFYDFGYYALGWIGDVPGDILDLLNLIAPHIPGVGKDISAGLTQLSQDWKQNVYNREKFWKPGRFQSRSVTIGSLQRRFQEMYQGQIITMGNPAMKPWDIFYLGDSYNQITGTAEVGQVTHSLSLDTGFTSTIKPDLCVTRADGAWRSGVMQACIYVGSAVTMKLTQKLMASNIAKGLAGIGAKSTAWTLKKTGGLAGKVAVKFTPESIVRTLKSGWLKAAQAGETVADYVKSEGIITDVLKFAKGNIVFSLITGAVSVWIEDLIMDDTEFNNCLFAYPLWKYDKPFVAGLAGGKHIIPGYIDPQYDDLTKLKQIDVTKKDGALTATAGIGTGTTPGAGGTTGLNSTVIVVGPVDIMHITGKFGEYRSPSDPHHRGLDIGWMPGQQSNTPIKSIADGVITNSGFEASMGNFIELQYNIADTPIHVTYMHMQYPLIKTSGNVSAGEVVGIMGQTGDATGVHLHIEVCKGTARVRTWGDPNLLDPEAFLAQYGVTFS